MDGPNFTYVTYIRSTPERLWRALMDPLLTARWWNLTFVSKWEVGSQMIWINNGVEIVDPEQVVLRVEPYRVLSYSWHTFTDELGERLNETMDFPPELVAALAREQRSCVTFELEQVGGATKLTLTHDNFESGSTAALMVREGWPPLLSSLKSLQETGEPLAFE